MSIPDPELMTSEDILQMYERYLRPPHLVSHSLSPDEANDLIDTMAISDTWDDGDAEDSLASQLMMKYSRRRRANEDGYTGMHMLWNEINELLHSADPPKSIFRLSEYLHNQTPLRSPLHPVEALVPLCHTQPSEALLDRARSLARTAREKGITVLPVLRFPVPQVRNRHTCLKEVAYYYGLVIAGSDEGRVYFYDPQKGSDVFSVRGDSHIVNALRPHPSLPIIAVSGIDSTIKLLGPTSKGASRWEEYRKWQLGTTARDERMSMNSPIQQESLSASEMAAILHPETLGMTGEFNTGDAMHALTAESMAATFVHSSQNSGAHALDLMAFLMMVAAQAGDDNSSESSQSSGI